MPKVTQQKCAGDACVCIIDIDDAIRSEAKNYCSSSCPGRLI
ncbi:MAG: hypothetical protein AAGA97_12045 [Pseudomonadota bacterium]